jgi:4,5-DOPA dioxygenase extradiol
MSTRMPAIFFGHGNPMNAIQRNEYTEAWSAIGAAIPRPKAVLAVSAHWYHPGTAVTAMEHPRTIHDFGGFPPQLYEVRYPAAGSPELARRVQELAMPIVVRSDDANWGLDHGTWSVLCHVFPEADVPVIQLSIDETMPPHYHYEFAKHLAPLRDEGVLIVGSGNVVHNLHSYSWGRHTTEPLSWAARFEERVRQLLLDGDDDAIVAYETIGAEAALAAPTPEHYLPLVYVIALRGPEDHVTFPVEGFDGGSVSMLAVQVGSR